MFGIGFFELIIIAVVALVVVGPKRLPEVMKQAGRLFVHLRRTANDVRSSFEQVIREAEDEIRREESESIRKAMQPVQDVRQELQGLMQSHVDGVDGADNGHSHHEPIGGEQAVHASTTPADANTSNDKDSPQAQAIPTPEHQPQGSQTFNPNGPGPLHKS
ncbi:MAG: twin-arginine translocase subunit TatB [Pseudomonadota bacterium]|jgi:sec-independent protein translocase protein TatB